MSLKCKLGFHEWGEDCEKCSKCVRERFGYHNWKNCDCSKCGKILHEWKGCMSSKPGKVLAEDNAIYT